MVVVVPGKNVDPGPGPVLTGVTAPEQASFAVGSVQVAVSVQADSVIFVLGQIFKTGAVTS